MIKHLLIIYKQYEDLFTKRNMTSSTPATDRIWIDRIPSAWKGHRDFAEWLVQSAGKKRVVELGVDRGFSLFTFATAGASVVYGVDLWESDPRYGYDNYQPILEELATTHGLANIQLIRGSFEEVAKSWSYDPIDILHLDGTHHYPDVKCDFETWFPFVKQDGVVLLHDVCVPEFTVKEYFNEIPYPKGWFRHSAGLGVVSRDENLLKQIEKVFPAFKRGSL